MFSITHLTSHLLDMVILQKWKKSVQCDIICILLSIINLNIVNYLKSKQVGQKDLRLHRHTYVECSVKYTYTNCLALLCEEFNLSCFEVWNFFFSFSVTASAKSNQDNQYAIQSKYKSRYCGFYACGFNFQTLISVQASTNL